MTDDRRISYTAEPLPEARIHPDARFLWLDPAAHPGADVNPTTVFAPAPEGFSFRAVEFTKIARRPHAGPGTLAVTVFADPKFRLWVMRRHDRLFDGEMQLHPLGTRGGRARRRDG